MKSKIKRTFSPDFKMQAVKLVTEQGYSIAKAAENLGICKSILAKWKRSASTFESQTDAFPGRGNLKLSEIAYKKLQKELSDTQKERDILKKAIAIFSKPKGIK